MGPINKFEFVSSVDPRMMKLSPLPFVRCSTIKTVNAVLTTAFEIDDGKTNCVFAVAPQVTQFDAAEYVGYPPADAVGLFPYPDLSAHVETLDPELNVTELESAPSNQSDNPDTLPGMLVYTFDNPHFKER